MSNAISKINKIKEQLTAASDALAVSNFLYISNWLELPNIEISGLRSENNISMVTFRDMPLGVKQSKPENFRFNIKLSLSDHADHVRKLLGWYHCVVKANDLLGDSRGDNQLKSWKTLKKSIEVSPDGKHSMTLERAFPSAWRLEGISDAKPGFFVMEFSYEKSGPLSETKRTRPNPLSSDKHNLNKVTCTMQFAGFSNARSNIKVSSISDFGSKVGTECILANNNPLQWINVKDGEMTWSTIRFEIEIQGQENSFNDLCNDQMASSYKDMYLIFRQDGNDAENLINLKLRNSIVRSIEFLNIRPGESPRCVVEIVPREISLESPNFVNQVPPTKELQNFTISLSEKKHILKAITTVGSTQPRFTPWIDPIEQSFEVCDWQASFLVIKPTFLAKSATLSFSPITNKRPDTDAVNTLPTDFMDDIIKPGHKGAPSYNLTKADSEWEGGDQRIQVEFFVYPCASTPVNMIDSMSLNAKLDNLIFFLMYGDVSLFNNKKINPKLSSETKLSVNWNQAKNLNQERYFVVVDTPTTAGMVITVENAGYIADKFDVSGRPSRFRVNITGLVTGIQ